jgi:hypothetical protein
MQAMNDPSTDGLAEVAPEPTQGEGTEPASTPGLLSRFRVADEDRTRWDEEADRADAALDALIEENRREREERAKLPPPPPSPPPPVPILYLAGDAHPETIAEELVSFYGIARARQIRQGLVDKLRFFKNRKSATWDLVQDDMIATRPADFE